ncbi:MAG: hypothetical protein WB801_05385, partial [Candidatus Dormiibacterota bacterium]
PCQDANYGSSPYESRFGGGNCANVAVAKCPHERERPGNKGDLGSHYEYSKKDAPECTGTPGRCTDVC